MQIITDRRKEVGTMMDILCGPLVFYNAVSAIFLLFVSFCICECRIIKDDGHTQRDEKKRKFCDFLYVIPKKRKTIRQ